MRGLNFQAFVSFAKQTHILVKHFSWDYNYWQYIFPKPVTVIKQIADSLQSFHFSLVAEEAQGCNGKLGIGSPLAASVFAQNLGRIETALKRQKCWFKGSISLGPAVKLQSGGRSVLWENHVHQQQLSVIKANLRSCVLLSLLGVSGTFQLMVLKTDSADWGGGNIAHFSTIFECANNKRLYFDLCVEDAVVKRLHAVQALLWRGVLLSWNQHNMYTPMKTIKLIFLLWENHMKHLKSDEA